MTKTSTVPLLQALRNRSSNFLDACVDSFDPLPSAASFLDQATYPVTEIEQVTRSAIFDGSGRGHGVTPENDQTRLLIYVASYHHA